MQEDKETAPAIASVSNIVAVNFMYTLLFGVEDTDLKLKIKNLALTRIFMIGRFS